MIGLFFYFLKRRDHFPCNVKNLYFFGVVVHLVMLGLMMFLPKNFVWVTFQTLAISVLLFYPVATVLIGKILSDHESQVQLFADIRESELRYRHLLEIAPVGIAVHAEGKLVFTNPAGKKLLGAESSEALNGKPLSEIIHPDRWEAARDRMQRMMAGEQGLYPAEDVYVRLDGSLIDVEVMAAPLWFNGKPAVQVIVTDITERKEAAKAMQKIQERLRQSEKMESIGQLAGGIAHDFNNVLGGIIGFTDLSLDIVDKGTRLESYLQKIMKASHRAKRLVEQILTFSRQSVPPVHVTNLQPILHEVLDLLRATIPATVSIDAQLDPDTKPVLADGTKIHEVMVNLVTNAVHAMDGKGSMSIRLYPLNLATTLFGRTGDILPGDYSVIEVADTGHGMDAETMARAFDPFFTTKPVGEGTGLGLSVVLGIVQLHGGDIQLESRPGHGTRIKIFLPACTDQVSEAANDGGIDSVSGAERVMFVDDETLLVEVHSHALANLGYEVQCFTDSQEALTFLRQHSADIDILVTDQNMPGMSGIDLAKEALKINRDFPIILCTGYSREADPSAMAAIGIKALLMKPYSPYELGKAIRRVLDPNKKE